MENLRNLEMLFESFDEAIYIVDKQRKILYFNPMATKITGYEKGEIEGFFCQNNILDHMDEEGNNLCLKGCPLLESIHENKHVEKYVYLKHKNGHRVKVLMKSMPYAINGEVIGAIEVFSDETETPLLNEVFPTKKNIGMIDPLTGLYNRRILDQHLMVYLQQQEVKELGVLFIDFDNFKGINDYYGHQHGDEVLGSMCRTISQNIRRQDISMRYGGDEVVVFILDVNLEELNKIAKKLQILIEESSPQCGRNKICITASIGGVIKAENESIKQAIDRADHAMFEIKKQGRKGVLVI